MRIHTVNRLAHAKTWNTKCERCSVRIIYICCKVLRDLKCEQHDTSNSQCSHTSMIIHYRKFAHTTTTCTQNNIHIASKNGNICGNIGLLDSCPYDIDHRVISIAISGIAGHLTDKPSSGKVIGWRLSMDDILLCKVCTVATKISSFMMAKTFSRMVFQ